MHWQVYEVDDELFLVVFEEKKIIYMCAYEEDVIDCLMIDLEGLIDGDDPKFWVTNIIREDWTRLFKESSNSGVLIAEPGHIYYDRMGKYARHFLFLVED